MAITEIRLNQTDKGHWELVLSFYHYKDKEDTPFSSPPSTSFSELLNLAFQIAREHDFECIEVIVPKEVALKA